MEAVISEQVPDVAAAVKTKQVVDWLTQAGFTSTDTGQRVSSTLGGPFHLRGSSAHPEAMAIVGSYLGDAGGGEMSHSDAVVDVVVNAAFEANLLTTPASPAPDKLICSG